MASSLLFICDDPRDEPAVRRVLRLLPQLAGSRVRLQRSPGLRDGARDVHAGSFLRERRIAFNCTRAEFARVFVHEIFHFVWLRAGNPLRLDYESMLLEERRRRGRGELGWSAEWRKLRLRESDIALRNCRWREYCCESFCDTAAWIFSAAGAHQEFTLAARHRRRRREWFRNNLDRARLSI